MNNRLLLKCMFLCGLLCQISLPIFAQEVVTTGLLKEIKQAQTELSDSQENIASQAEVLAKKIRQYQSEVVALREKATVKRRVVDEQTLALSKIQSRLAQWLQQERYQRNLLSDAAEQSLLSQEQKLLFSSSLANGIPLMLELAKRQQESVLPIWKTERIMSSDGEYQMADVLQLGPVIWFLQVDKQQAGLLSQERSVLLYFDEPQRQQLQTLRESGQGNVVFDPTLGTASKLKQQQESPWQHLLRGGVWVIPIIAFGVFALLIGLLKTIQLQRLPKLFPMLAEKVELVLVGDNATEQLEKLRPQLRGAQQCLLDITLSTEYGEKRDDKLLAFLLEYRQKLQANLGAIAITASISPLLGLLGTVSGMIETFNMMSLFGAGDPAVVSGGISKALITTELGLVVAIPALIIHALLNRFIRNHNTQLDTTAIRLAKLVAHTHTLQQVEGQAA
ncbi:MotA/TolQ/ExbB proton channel family protein [Paraglaciecola psychrophila]|nr:MotA/TolQ/ExbB proton channel family protein [Paraglaciecola psychrophila]